MTLCILVTITANHIPWTRLSLAQSYRTKPASRWTGGLPYQVDNWPIAFLDVFQGQMSMNQINSTLKITVFYLCRYMILYMIKHSKINSGSLPES